MPRDIERARDGLKSTPATVPEAPGDAEPEPDIADRPLAPAQSKMPAIPVDPELLRYRHRLDQQLAAWREGKSGTSLGTSLATITAAPAPGFGHALLILIAPIAACGAAAFAGWWLASVPATRTGEELAQVRLALQQEQDKAEKLVTTLAAAWRELGAQAAALADKDAQEHERDTLQKALQQSEAAAATFAQSLAQERDRNQELEQQLAAHRDPAPAPGPAADTTSDKPPAEAADPEHLRLMSRASLLLAQGDIGAARVVLERAAESGSAPALFALAETFDPAVLSAWGTMGTQGDAARAGDLYAKALAGGIAAAKDRLATLRR
jgi:hypothetical protein